MSKFTSVLSFFVFCFLVFACQKPLTPLPQAQTPVSRSADEPALDSQDEPTQILFKNLFDLKKAGKSDAAIAGFEKFATANPDSRLADDAYYQIGMIHLENNRFKKAAAEFLEIIERFPTADTIAQAKYQYGVALYRLNALEEALPILESVDVKRLPDDIALGFYDILRTAYRKTQERDKLLSINLELLERQPNKSELEDEILKLINEDLDVRALEQVAASRRDEFPAGYALMQLARLYFKEGDFSKVRGRLRAFLTRFRDRGQPHEHVKEAELLLERLGRLEQVQVNRVGLLLPLTGKFSPVGQRILNGVLLAADLFNQQLVAGEAPLQIVIGDTAGDEDRALKAVDELVLDYQVVGLIGPVLKKTSIVAAEAAKIYKVPMVVLSQEEEITAISDYVFQNCLRTSDQVDALAKFVVEEMDVTRIAMLYPKHSYGQDMFWRMWEALSQYPQVDIRGVEAYEKNKADFSGEVRRLIGLFYLRPRAGEVCRKGQTTNCFERTALPPIVDFEALFIPDSAEKVRQIAPALSYHGVRGVQLIGANLWNTPTLLEKNAHRYLQGAIFVDGFYPQSQNPKVKGFVEEYAKEFSEEPDILSAQAHDTMKIIVQAHQQQKLTTRDDLRRFLKGLRAFEGVTGRMAFRDQGDAQKELYYFTVDGSRIRPLLNDEGIGPKSW